LSAAFAGEADDETAPADRARLAALVIDRYPFEVVLEDVILPLHSTEVNRPIRELGLRPQTGATIAAIYRDEVALVNPNPDEILTPDDVVVLLGSRSQVERAMAYLARLAAVSERSCT